MVPSLHVVVYVYSAAHRSKSASQATSFIDSDSYVVVGKEHVVGENQAAAGLDSLPPPRDTASRATLGREPARDSSTGDTDGIHTNMHPFTALITSWG